MGSDTTAQLLARRTGFVPVVAAMRRRVGQRRVVAVALVVLVVGAGVGAWLGLRSSSQFVATRPLGRAFMKQGLTEAAGRPVLGGGSGGTQLQYMPFARFALGIVLTNESPEPVTLLDVRAVLPRDRFVRQIGTRMVAFNPSPCPADASCPAPAFRLQGMARCARACFRSHLGQTLVSG